MKLNKENYWRPIFFVFGIASFLYSITLMSQEKGMMGKAGGDMGNMGAGGMVISGAVGIAVIVALVALTLFLIRRSKA
ncbi:MAG: hypothetical protein SGJ18_02870 [Pseudomonadota bacterium]|nr:hypothetical protein [Pseudomonadota bacterium]